MKNIKEYSVTSIAIDLTKCLGLILACMFLGYMTGRLIESLTVKKVYSVQTSVTYMHERYKGQSKDNYQEVINADNATINSLVNMFNQENQKIQAYKTYSKMYNTSVAYNDFVSSVNVTRHNVSRRLIFTGKSTDLDVAARLSRAYAENAVTTIQRISNDASIVVELNSQKIIKDKTVGQHFGNVFMLLGLAFGIVLTIIYWLRGKKRRIFYNTMMNKLNSQ